MYAPPPPVFVRDLFGSEKQYVAGNYVDNIILEKECVVMMLLGAGATLSNENQFFFFFFL